MKDFQTLKLLDRFEGLFERMGVQYPVMRRILQVKLTMDGRRAVTIASGSGTKARSQNKRGQLLGGTTSNTYHPRDGEEEESGNRFLRSLWLYLLIGFVMIPFTLMGTNYMFQMSLTFGILIFMITTSLISDFSSVLLDVRDKNIISSKPVSRRTVSMAKTLHILIYMSFITGAVTLPSLIAGLVRHGVGFFLIYLIEIILMDLLIVVLTALLYFVVLRYFDGEKLKDIINYVQIGLTIGITVGYQLVIRLFDVVDVSFQFQPQWWQVFLPPVWFAGPFELLLHGDHQASSLIFTMLAVLFPLLSIAIYLQIMPAFERNLSKLTEQSAREGKGRSRFWSWVGRRVTSSKEEAVFFGFASIMMGKERDFKLKVYPTLGFSIIFPFIFLFSGLERGEGLAAVASGKMYLFIYFCALLVPSVVLMLRYSGQYKGAWIFRTIPLNNMAAVYKGTLKAFIAKLLIPLFLIEAMIFVLMFGTAIIPDMIAVGLSLFLYTFISHAVLRKDLPFSQPFETAQSGDSLKMIPLMFVLGIFAGVHYLSTMVNFGVYIYMLLLLVSNYIAWHWGFGLTSNESSHNHVGKISG